MIATLATRAAAEGIDVVIVTGDRDSYQLVSDPHIKVLYNKRGVSDYALYDEAGILERTGVTPAQYPEYAALRGDPSDNLPGVPGIGEKTAAKLVNTYGNLEGIFEHLDELPPKQRQNLGEARDRVFLNRRDVAAAHSTARSTSSPPTCAWARGTASRSALLFDQLAFRTLLPAPARGDRGAGRRHRERGARRRGARRSATRPTVLELLAELAAAGEPFAVEPRWEGAPVVEPAARAGHRARRRATPSTSTRRCSGRRRSSAALDALFADGGPPLVAHRAKELMHGLRARHPHAAPRHRGDGVPARSRARGSTSSTISRCGFLSLEVQSPDAEPGTLDLDGELEVEQTGRRAVVVLRLAAALDDALDARELTDLYERFELPLVRVLARMETRRHPHRPRVPRGAAARTSPSSATCTCSAIHAHAGEEFNVNSTPQLRTILFESSA